MEYCHKCGKRLKELENFCTECGAKIKEVVGDVEERVEEVVKETKSRKGLFIFIILLIIIGYIILDFWAISQLTPVLSIGSIFASISNLGADFGLTQTKLSSSIRVENPTFVPIIFARISYDANYGNIEVADGKTGFFIIGPYSQKDIPVDLTVYHVGALTSGLKWVWDTITGQQERKYINIYADIGLAKFKLKTLE